LLGDKNPSGCRDTAVVEMLLLVGVLSEAAEGLEEDLFPALRVFGDRKPRGLREREFDFLGVLEADAQDAVEVDVDAVPVDDPPKAKLWIPCEEDAPPEFDPKRPFIGMTLSVGGGNDISRRSVQLKGTGTSGLSLLSAMP
jgi:hypothetical protein